MSRSLFSLLVSSTLVLGCGAAKPIPAEDFADLEGVDQKADAFSYRMKIVGSLDYGQTSAPVAYTASPRFRAFKLAGQKGDRVEVEVRSDDGDAVAWLLDDSFRTLAFNDDASRATLDSRLAVTLPGNRRPEIVTYYVVFREYDLAKARFTVALKGPAKADYFACAVDADCVAVPMVGCCNGWKRIAVNGTRAAAYAASGRCEAPYPPCAAPPRDEANPYAGKVALCSNDAHRCELVAPTEIACGGRVRANPHQCPKGYVCAELGNDAPGRCEQGCMHNGQLHPAGSSFPAGDGCNTCSCTAEGLLGCTKIGCPSCNPAREPNRRYAGRSVDECARIRFFCQAPEKAFHNDCGCGCEKP